MLFQGGYNFETPPPEVSADGTITVNPPTGARTLNSRTAMFYYATGNYSSHDHATDGNRFAISRCVCGFRGQLSSMAQRPTRSLCPKIFRRRNSGHSPFTTTRAARCLTRRNVIPAPVARAIRRPPPRRTPMAPRPCISARQNRRGGRGQLDPDRPRRKAGTRCCAFTARSNPFSLRPGGQAKSNW